jgi:Domain of unknown function (DUF2437)
MRLVSFVHDGRTACGVLEDDRILVDPGSRQADLKTVLEQNALSGFAEACAASGRSIPLEGVTLLPVITNPGKILCVGHNYEEHRQETGRAKTAHPSLFVRFADTLFVHHSQPRSTSRGNWRSSSDAAVSASHPTRLWTSSPAIPASMTAASAIGSGIHSSSRRARTSRRPVGSGRPSSRRTRSGHWTISASKPGSTARWFSHRHWDT